MTNVNPVQPPVALLRVQMPDVFLRESIYDPTWDNPAYNTYQGQRIVPAVGSLVKDPDGTALWVVAVDPTTLYPSYDAVTIGEQNDNVLSMINWGNSDLRLFVDHRKAPYPVTPDTKCIFIGKSPQTYTLSRYPGTPQETLISQYFSSTGGLVSSFVPMKPLDATNTSWYLPKANISQRLDNNEEIKVRVYDESGMEVYSAILHAKESTVINESVMYAPSITGITVTGNQQLSDGTFFLLENQDFASLGIKVNLLYEDGSTQQVQIDGQKCILYGQSDFIASFAGLAQNLLIKYFRSQNESISPLLADATGNMISVQIKVKVLPNTLGTTVKIMPMPSYNAALARYMMRYYMYFGDGRSFVDVTTLVTTGNKTLVTDSSQFGITQTVTLSVDMSQVDPANYGSVTIYQQTMVIQFGPPAQVVKWFIRDAATSTYVYGLDAGPSRRPSLRYDASKVQYFIPSFIFSNQAAFLNSFYQSASPPYDPQVEQIPQTPTHFVVRDMATGNMLVTEPIPVSSYQLPFNILGDSTGQYVGSTIVFEFLNVLNIANRRVLFGVPVDVTSGTYIAS